MGYDRESVTKKHMFDAGVNSPAVSTARYAWQSIHFPSNFVDCTITFQFLNETDGSWVDAIDFEGVAIGGVSVVAGQALPVNQYLNHAKVWRFVCSAAQPAGLEFSTVNKT